MKPVVLMLAYNAEQTIARTFEAIPDSLKPHAIVGDDCSTDGTSEVVRSLGLRVVRHERNLKYGGNLKRLYQLFLEEGGDIAIEVHADYQYEPSLIDLMVEYIARGHYDLIPANRIRSRAEVFREACLSIAISAIAHRYESESSSVSVPGLFPYTYRTVACALNYPPWRRERLRTSVPVRAPRPLRRG